MGLTPEEREQWKRQLAIPQFGEKAQNSLRKSRVVVFGVGGVGCAAALYLAAAGVGTLVLVDKDVVTFDNLNRQILYHYTDLGKPKAQIAATRLQALNPHLVVEVVEREVAIEEITTIVKGSSAVVDTFDRNKSRLEINEVCVRQRIAVAHGFAQDLSGEVIFVKPGETACLHCVLDENFPELEECPVLGVTAGLIGVQLSSMVIKYLTGCGVVKAGYRLIWDLVLDQFVAIPLERQICCPVCSCAYT